LDSTSQWSPQVSGYGLQPWTNPGGDYLSEKTKIGFIKRKGDSDITIEVTKLIKGFHNGSTTNYGLIVRQTGIERRPFNTGRMGPQGNGRFAQLIIQAKDRL